MQLDSLTRLIQTATPELLRTLAVWTLSWLGHRPELTDGPYDGGLDIRLLGPDGSVLPHVVALSVEMGWEKKLREDLTKARQHHSFTTFTFVSSRRIPETAFGKLEVEYQLHGIHLRKMDCQSLASHILDEGRLRPVLDLFGITGLADGRPAPTPRQDVAFAFAFFAPPVSRLRQEAQERAVELAVLQLGGTASRQALTDTATALLSGSLDAASVAPVVDRLRLTGRLLGRNGHVSLAPAVHDELRGVLRLYAHEEAQLQASLLAWAETQGAAAPARLARQLWPDLGDLLLPQVEALHSRAGRGPALRRIRALLEDHGLSRPGLEASLLAVIEASAVAGHLRAGAILRAMCALPRYSLEQALGAVTGLRLILDASVVLPTLCCLYHEPISARFFQVGTRLVQKAQEGGIPLAIPAVWLEEVAAHLLSAWNYVEAVALDPSDLRGSTNTFVAWFASAPADADFPTFSSFLESFVDLPAALREQDFVRARDLAAAALERILARFGIQTVDTPAAPPMRRTLEERWMWAHRGADRATILVRHDLDVLAWLNDRNRPAGTLAISWDRTLFELAEPGRLFDPLAMLELLSLTQDGRPPDGALTFVAQTIDEAALTRASAVWDALVQLEQGRLREAALAQKALRFKRDYLARRAGELDLVDLRRSWERLRAEADSAADEAAPTGEAGQTERQGQ